MTSTAADGPDVLQLFPTGTHRDTDGRLVVAGCRLDDVAQEYGTPTYVVAEDAMRAQARRFLDGLRTRRPGSDVAFASKAFPASAVYRLMAEEGLHVDVAGGGELLLALNGGVDPQRVIVHGNAKTDDEIRLALDAAVGLLVVDNLDEVERIEALASRRQPVLLRIQPGVDPGTHAAISTGQKGSKFGVPLEQVADVVKRIEASSAMELQGLHLHLGSQMMQLEPFPAAVEVIGSLGEFPVYDVGGGLAVRYTYAEHPPTVEQWLDSVTTAAESFLPAGARLIIEPGRSMVAESVVTLYRVVVVKPGDPSYVAVDGGIADNFEASTYIGQEFEATLVARGGGDQRYDVVGRQCESGDRIAPDVALADPRRGDVLAVPVTGAYTHTLANNYNGALRAPVVFCKDGRIRLVVRRDTPADLLAREVG